MKKYILLFVLFLAGIIRAQNIPLVYDVENTGTSFPSPVLPDLGQLPVMELLPNPFMWSDGSGYIASFADWSRRRAMSFDRFYEVASLGAVLFSQNSLSTAETMIGYSYHNGFHSGHLKFTYSGWYPVIELSADIYKQSVLHSAISPWVRLI